MAQYIEIIETRSRVIRVENTDDVEVALDAVAAAYNKGYIVLTDADVDTGPHFEDATERWINDDSGVTSNFTRIQVKDHIVEAEIRFKKWINYDTILETPSERDKFIATYGYSPEDAMDRNSEEYCLIALAEIFQEQFYDCAEDEDSVWNQVLEEFMESEKRFHQSKNNP